MFKTLLIFAFIALALTQSSPDVSDVVSSVQNAAGSDISDVVSDVNNSAIGSTTVGQIASNPQAVVSEVQGASSELNSLPALESLTIGWGNREVVVTNSNPSATNEDWISSNEELDIEREMGGAAEGEWTLTWTTSNGTWAIWNENGDLVVVDSMNGETNIVDNLENDPALDAEIANGAESLVDEVYSNNVTTVSTNDIDNLVSQVLNNQNLQGFLAQQQNNGATVSSVVSAAAANPSQAVSTAESDAAANGV